MLHSHGYLKHFGRRGVPWIYTSGVGNDIDISKPEHIDAPLSGLCETF